MTTPAQSAAVYCQKCGAPMGSDDRFCRKCGWDSTVPIWTSTPVMAGNVSDKKRAVAALLCFLLGFLGVHRFYVGKIGTGLLWLFTLGILGIGMLVDLILIVAGEFRDDQGRKIVIW